jgi:PAS domain S-box-containing protein
MENIKLIKIANYCYWNTQTEQVLLNNNSITLTISETKLLKLFINSMNKPISSVDLYFYIWEDYQKEFNSKSIRNLVSSLRKTLPMITIKNIYGGFYILQKSEEYPDNDFKEYLFEFLDQSQNGIIITDPNKEDNPIIYVNSAFTNLFEYTLEEVKGKNCRFMHKTDNEQLSLQDIKIAIKNEKSITLNVRNYTKKGSLIYNEVTISPIFDKQKGKLKYFMGVIKDVTLIHDLKKQIMFSKKNKL